MSDPFQTVDSFDANSFANGLLKAAAGQRNRLESDYKNNVATLWHRPSDHNGEWTLAKVQSVLDALGPAGAPLFAASAMIGYVAAIGKISKDNPAIFLEAATALYGVLLPYFTAGTLDPADFVSPVKTNVEPDGSVTIDPTETEYPGPIEAA